MYTSLTRFHIPLLLFAVTGCSGPGNVTQHSELPAGSVIEVTFDQPGSSLLAFEIAGSRIISEGGLAIQAAYSPDIAVAVRRMAAWTPESAEDGVVSSWGVLVREDGEELLVEFLRNKTGKLQKLAFDGPLFETLAVDE